MPPFAALEMTQKQRHTKSCAIPSIFCVCVRNSFRFVVHIRFKIKHKCNSIGASGMDDGRIKGEPKHTERYETWKTIVNYFKNVLIFNDMSAIMWWNALKHISRACVCEGCDLCLDQSHFNQWSVSCYQLLCVLPFVCQSQIANNNSCSRRSEH